MPLIKCPDCETEISDAAPACVKCGRPMLRPASAASPGRRSDGTAIKSAVGGFLVGFVLVWGGCGEFQAMDGRGYVICAMGGAVFGILGAILGAAIGASSGAARPRIRS